MDVSQALKQRKSTRAFLSKSVEKEKIDFILEHARYAPSGVNTQPWQVAVLSGARKERLQSRFEEAFEQNIEGKMDYQYYPLIWSDTYKGRRKETGLLMYQTLGITKEDKAGQKRQWKANYRAFDAPVMLLFFIDKDLEKGSYVDYGMFLQSLMLLAVEQGLATCPQAALAEYPDIVRDELGISEDKLLLLGVALGYEDVDAKVNSFRTTRMEVKSFTNYYE